MTSRDFLYWLQGYFEIKGIPDGGKYPLTDMQVSVVLEHVGLVMSNPEEVDTDTLFVIGSIYGLLAQWEHLSFEGRGSATDEVRSLAQSMLTKVTGDPVTQFYAPGLPIFNSPTLHLSCGLGPCLIEAEEQETIPSGVNSSVFDTGFAPRYC